MGVIAFDGAGNYTGTFTTVQVVPDPKAATVQVQTGPIAGPYKVNADGAGTTKEAGGAAFSFVITDGGSGLMPLAGQSKGPIPSIWYSS
jgi:hypothetical protein